LLGEAAVQPAMPVATDVSTLQTVAETDHMVDLSKPVPHVLIADRNDRTLAARAKQLLAAGLRVSQAHTAFEAIVKASCYVPDFILLDGSLVDLDAAATGQLLTTCPMTAHIPIFQLRPGRRVPQRVVAAALRQSA
jgi:response regulator RpfG family c-di-GMP phosphodiesterase